MSSSSTSEKSCLACSGVMWVAGLALSVVWAGLAGGCGPAGLRGGLLRCGGGCRKAGLPAMQCRRDEGTVGQPMRCLCLFAILPSRLPLARCWHYVAFLWFHFCPVAGFAGVQGFLGRLPASTPKAIIRMRSGAKCGRKILRRTAEKFPYD